MTRFKTRLIEVIAFKIHVRVSSSFLFCRWCQHQQSLLVLEEAQHFVFVGGGDLSVAHIPALSAVGKSLHPTRRKINSSRRFTKRAHTTLVVHSSRPTTSLSCCFDASCLLSGLPPLSTLSSKYLYVQNADTRPVRRLPPSSCCDPRRILGTTTRLSHQIKASKQDTLLLQHLIRIKSLSAHSQHDDDDATICFTDNPASNVSDVILSQRLDRPGHTVGQTHHNILH